MQRKSTGRRLDRMRMSEIQDKISQNIGEARGVQIVDRPDSGEMEQALALARKRGTIKKNTIFADAGIVPKKRYKANTISITGSSVEQDDKRTFLENKRNTCPGSMTASEINLLKALRQQDNGLTPPTP